MDILTLALAQNYTSESLMGAGAVKGKDGTTPHIGENHHWFIGEEDTGIYAEGVTPHIGSNNHWFIGTIDTEVVAQGKNGVGIQSITPHVNNSTKGNKYTIKLTDGSTYDFIAPMVDNEGTGSTIENLYMRLDNGYLQYSTDGSTWNNIFAISEIESQPNVEEVYIGTEEPTDDNIKIWINSSDEPTDLPSNTPNIAIGNNGNLFVNDIDTEIRIVPQKINDTNSTSVTLTPQDGTEYRYGTLTSLTLYEQPQANYECWIKFSSGETATTLTIPSTMKVIGELDIKPNKTYEISIKDNVIAWGYY